MKVKTLDSIFKENKPIIGMIHLDYLEGKNSKGINSVVRKAIKEIKILQKNGIDGLLIENWKEEERKEFVSSNTITILRDVFKELRKHLQVPYGINILSNDYKSAFILAKEFGGSFVQLDAFVDRIRTDFSYDKAIKSKSFVISPKPREIDKWSKKLGANEIPLLAFVQPKHSILLEKNKTIEKSTKQAVAGGASGVIVTKATGLAPTLNNIKKVKKVAGRIPVGVGSGLNYENISDFFPVMDFAIVGSYFKKNGNVDNNVDPGRVKKFMRKMEYLRKKNKI